MAIVDKNLSKIIFHHYALKRMRRRVAFRNNSKKAIKRLAIKIQVIKSLKHNYTVQYIGTYTDKADVGLIMSLVADMDLALFMERICLHIQATSTKNNGISAPRLHKQALAERMCSTLRICFGCLAAALAYLHNRSIRYKDIKLQNVLVNKGNVL